jgi:glyoxylase-like metal-dependent hydrolase (beta-lactamase superfamily II)
MEDEMKLQTLVAGVMVCTAPTVGLAQRDFSKVEITTIRVAEAVSMLEGAGGNIGVSVGADGVFLIDDQYAPLTDKIVAAVGAIDERPIRFVLNTHWHSDHTGGNENLGGAGALIVAHDNVRVRMSTEQFLEAFDRRVPPSPESALPVVTFSDTVTFHINGDTVHAFHVDPAHTDGDSIVHFSKANVIHMGDVMFSGMYPFIDVGAGGSLTGVIAACDRALELADDDTKIIPGHGPLSTRADLEAYRAMLAGVRDAVAPLVVAGKSLEEMRQADPLAPFNETWGGGMEPEVFLGIVYESLKSKP